MLSAHTIVLASLLLWLAPLGMNTVVAQAIHLPPPFRPAVEEDRPLVLIHPLVDSMRATQVFVQDDQIVVVAPGETSRTFPFGDKTIQDLEAYIDSQYKGRLDAEPRAPLTGARQLRTSDEGYSISDDNASIAIMPREQAPEVVVGFGAVMSLGPPDVESDNGLLSRTGFQLDLVGIHQLLARRGKRPDIYVMGRIGLNSDQELQVLQSETSGAEFEAALQQADQVDLTAQIDFVKPILSPRQEIGVFLNVSIGWAKLDPLRLPSTVLVGEDRLPFEESFGEEAIARLRRQHAQVLPLGDYDVGGVLRFIRDDQPAFYLGGGIQFKELLQRGIAYRVEEGVLSRESLKGTIRTPRRVQWRAMIGARLGGLVDVRADASGPIGRDISPSSEPLLRLVLAKSFPIYSDQP